MTTTHEQIDSERSVVQAGISKLQRREQQLGRALTGIIFVFGCTCALAVLTSLFPRQVSLGEGVLTSVGAFAGVLMIVGACLAAFSGVGAAKLKSAKQRLAALMDSNARAGEHF